MYQNNTNPISPTAPSKTFAETLLSGECLPCDGIYFTISAQTPSITPTATPRPSATPTILPTNTQTPSATPTTSPTNTPKPSLTLIPTATPTQAVFSPAASPTPTTGYLAQANPTPTTTTTTTSSLGGGWGNFHTASNKYSETCRDSYTPRCWSFLPDSDVAFGRRTNPVFFHTSNLVLLFRFPFIAKTVDEKLVLTGRQLALYNTPYAARVSGVCFLRENIT